MWQIHQVRNRDITSNDRAPRQVCSCEDDRPHRNTHRHRHFTHEHRPRVVGTTTLGHDACTRSSAVVLATEAPARCASQHRQPAAASSCTLCRYRHTCPWMTLQPLLPPQKPLTSPDLLSWYLRLLNAWQAVGSDQCLLPAATYGRALCFQGLGDRAAAEAGMKWNSFMSYGVSTRKRTRWRTPAWTGRQRTRRTSTFDRCRRTRHPANGWGTAVNSPWKVYHLRRSVRAA